MIRRAGPLLLVTLMSSYQKGPAERVQTLLPRPFTAGALFVHDYSKSLFQTLQCNEMIQWPAPVKVFVISTACNVDTLADGY